MEMDDEIDIRPITTYSLTAHARFEMERRQIAEAEVAEVLSSPEQAEVVRPGRIVCQSRFQSDLFDRVYLLRVFVDIDRKPPEVMTVYRTSKVEKYWRLEQ